jgi:hypothetical protein
MSLVAEAVARYHKLIESEPYIDLAWAHTLQERIKAEQLDGRPISPVLRPHFLTARDYTVLSKSAELLLSAIRRVATQAFLQPALLNRAHLLPAEKMLAAVDPGYSAFGVTELLDAAISDGALHVHGYQADVPAGVLYGDPLADLYFEAPPVKEFRKKYSLKKIGGVKHLLTSILKAYKETGGKNKKPNIAIVEFRPPFPASAPSEYAKLAAFFTREGYPSEVVSPEQLEYRANILRHGDFVIDIIFRRFKLQEFLVRYDLNHALMRAYKERAVCVVNSFRAELGAKKVIFEMLTDEAATAKFPAAEKKAIRDFVPWTRLVQAAKSTYHGRGIDLPEFVLKHRAKLVIKPNDDSTGIHPVRGTDVDDAAWERALREAMRTPSVVQESRPQTHAVFPLIQFGSLMMKDMVVHAQPHAFLGKVQGASSWLSVAGTTGFSTLTGVAPTFVISGK